ncbi:MAG: hypothetical protein L0H59_06665 [Tomitella sp.]|nr:hypothetical protein [Tomitella sp.]
MPNSFVWIGLVVVWIFVLFPMVAGKRSPVRRTGEATLATRVLHHGGMTRPMRRGPASGHAGDPDWQPTEQQERARRRRTADPGTTRAEAQMDSGTTRSETHTRTEPHGRAEGTAGARSDAARPDDDVLDAEVGEVGTESRGDVGRDGEQPGRDEGARDEGVDRSDATRSAGARADAGVRADIGGDPVQEERPAETSADDVSGGETSAGKPFTEAGAKDTTSGAADADPDAETEPRAEEPPVNAEEAVQVDDADETEASAVHRPGRGGFDPRADAIASAERYRTRQRVVMSMAGGFVVTAVLALLSTSLFWWVTGILGVGLVLYLGYLRRQVHIEKEIRRRRLARLKRSRRDAAAQRRTRDTVPGPPRRQGVIVLEADDEDPSFEHLPPYAHAPHENLRHASGQ